MPIITYTHIILTYNIYRFINIFLYFAGWKPVPKDSEYYFEIPEEYYDYYDDIYNSIDYYTSPEPYKYQSVTPKPYYQFHEEPNITKAEATAYHYETNQQDFDAIDSIISEKFIQPEADERQTSIIFGVPVANFGVRFFFFG